MYVCILYIYAIMKTMCPPSYHHSGFVATHVLEHMMYGLPVHHLLKCMMFRHEPYIMCPSA